MIISVPANGQTVFTDAKKLSGSERRYVETSRKIRIMMNNLRTPQTTGESPYSKPMHLMKLVRCLKRVTGDTASGELKMTSHLNTANSITILEESKCARANIPRPSI